MTENISFLLCAAPIIYYALMRINTEPFRKDVYRVLLKVSLAPAIVTIVAFCSVLFSLNTLSAPGRTSEIIVLCVRILTPFMYLFALIIISIREKDKNKKRIYLINLIGSGLLIVGAWVLLFIMFRFSNM